MFTNGTEPLPADWIKQCSQRLAVERTYTEPVREASVSPPAAEMEKETPTAVGVAWGGGEFLSYVWLKVCVHVDVCF